MIENLKSNHLGVQGTLKPCEVRVNATIALCMDASCPVRLGDSTLEFPIIETTTLFAKLAQVPEQSEFTHSVDFVAAGHL